MNALLALLTWFLGIFNPTAAAEQMPGVSTGMEITAEDAQDVHIVNTNPRTVVALDDTHFRPNR